MGTNDIVFMEDFMHRKTYLSIFLSILVFALFCGCSSSKENIQQEQSSDNSEQIETDAIAQNENINVEESQAIGDTISSFMEKCKGFDKSIDDILTSNRITTKGVYMYLWDDVFISDDRENYPYYPAMSENASSISYTISDINFEDNSGTAKVAITYNKISSQILDAVDWSSDSSQVWNSEAEYNEALKNKIQENISEGRIKSKTKEIDINLKKSDNKWLIDNNVSFDRVFINVLTGNVYNEFPKRYGTFDRGAILNEDGTIKDPQKIKLGKKIEKGNIVLSLDTFETGLSEYRFGSNGTLNLGDGVNICKITGSINYLLGTTIELGNGYLGNDMIYSELIIDDNYHYEGSVTTESSVYGEVLGGQEKPVYIGFGVPDDIINNASSIDLRIGWCIFDEMYLQEINDLDDCRFRFIYKLK